MPMTTNTYQTPATSVALHRVSPANPPWVRSACRFGWMYPIAIVSGFYATWCVGWMSLGHAPRPSLDDPSSIGPFVDALSLLTVILVVGFPIGIAAGIGGELCAVRRTTLVKAVRLIGLAVCWGLAHAVLYLDPHDVVLWFMD